jgi:aspartate/methionine/tyrosine aminotransferase
VGRLVRHEENGWLSDLGARDRLVSAGTRLIAVNNPSKPAGALIDGAGLARIARIAGQGGSRVLCDGVYQGVRQHGDGFTTTRRRPVRAGHLHRQHVSITGGHHAHRLATGQASMAHTAEGAT